MVDKVIRDLFHRNVLEQAHAESQTLVLDEFSLQNGGCRADIAVLNGKMIGYEIKTDRDTLTRLEAQVIAYSEVFDNAYIIVGEKYLKKVKQVIPDWWGIFLIVTAGENIYSFKQIKKSKKNVNKNKLGILQLLWKDEIIKILDSYAGISAPHRATKKELYQLVLTRLSDKTLSKLALQFLKSREGWRIGRKGPYENAGCFQPISKL